MTPLRILYIDVNASFHNPTRNLLPVALCRAGEAYFFGPGYVDGETLRAGVEAYVERHGPFDVAATNVHILQPDLYGGLPSLAQYRRWYDFSFPDEQIAEVGALAAAMERLRLPRVAILLEADTYNWTERHIELLERRSDYVIGFGPEFTRFKADMPDLAREPFAPRATDVWAVWVNKNRQRVASLVHFVGDDEFAWRLLAHRPRTWSVLGAHYHARSVARDVLVRNGLKPIQQTPLRRGSGLLKRLNLLKESRLLQRFMNFDFQMRLQTCRYSYTCGSAVGLGVRKFFEIPAAGAVLVCLPFEGFAATGFRDGENAIACAPQDVMDAHRMLEGDLDRAQRIADAGRDLVLREHSLAARAGHFRESFAAMADGTFAGGRWEEGHYVVARREVARNARA